MTRIILHADLDCFFAAVEIRDDPLLKGLPLVVGARMVELEDLPGVGPATMMRLRQAGYNSVESFNST